MMGRTVIWALTAAFALAACGGPKKAPPPRRPKAKSAADDGPFDKRTDCRRTNRKRQLPPVPFDERSVDEADNLADEGQALLRQSSARSIEPKQREELITDAVNRLTTALLADPYNVDATYTLAAAYARIGRAQCAVNLLARLVPLRKHRPPC